MSTAKNTNKFIRLKKLFLVLSRSRCGLTNSILESRSTEPYNVYQPVM